MRGMITGIRGVVDSHLTELVPDNIFRDHIPPPARAGQSRHRLPLGRPELRTASWHSPSETFNTNIFSQVNLLDALRHRKAAARFLVTGSSEECGRADPDDLPIKETNPLRRSHRTWRARWPRI